MEQSHPPYASGALTIPRQLERWLDINPQNGPLRRTETFITIPAFNVPYTWLGYSDIVVSFNFEAPNNFSLKSISGIINNPNFYLCISYRVGNIVTRYALWQNVGEVLFFSPPPLYIGQPIKKNFRLEVWSTSQGSPAVSSSDSLLYTSVKGNIDYRFGSDSNLTNNLLINTSFECDSSGLSDSATPLIWDMATYDDAGPALAFGLYSVNGFVVGQMYTFQVGGNGASLSNGIDGHVQGDVFVATSTTYVLQGVNGTYQMPVTSQVTGPMIEFFLPLVFPVNSVSVTN